MTRQRYGFLLRFPGITDSIITPAGIVSSSNPDAEPGTVRALWDTGAAQSLLCAGTAERLGLEPHGRVTGYLSTGEVELVSYKLHLVFPNDVSVRSAIMFGGPEADNSEFDAIIGMDIISNGDFTISHEDGQTCVSFHVPSMGCIDFDADRPTAENI